MRYLYFLAALYFAFFSSNIKRESPSLIQFLQLKVNNNLQIQTQLVDKNIALDKISNKKRRISSEERGTSYDEELLDLNLNMGHLTIS